MRHPPGIDVIILDKQSVDVSILLSAVSDILFSMVFQRQWMTFGITISLLVILVCVLGASYLKVRSHFHFNFSKCCVRNEFWYHQTVNDKNSTNLCAIVACVPFTKKRRSSVTLDDNTCGNEVEDFSLFCPHISLRSCSIHHWNDFELTIKNNNNYRKEEK